MRVPYCPKAPQHEYENLDAYKNLSEDKKAKIKAEYDALNKRMQDGNDSYYADLGIEVELAETILPVSGGKGFQLHYFQDGAQIKSLTDRTPV